jgi:NTP pyrophosphatase (non-canonical NTP hydrolase)
MEKKENLKEISGLRKEYIYRLAMHTYGIQAQVFMLFEECSELMNVIAKSQRGRVSKEDIITELADVSIMVEQFAFMYGQTEFENEKNRKLVRLHERLLKHLQNNR